MATGIAGIQNKRRLEEQKAAQAKELKNQLIQEAKKQTQHFEDSLKQFATNNSKKINEDPEFRAAFNELCLQIGVDPLQSRRGIWGKFLKVGNFYHELAIKTIEITLRFKRKNMGGLIPLETIIEEVKKTYATKTKISSDDIKTAIKGLNAVGRGYSISTINKKKYLVVDFQVDDDKQTILNLADSNGMFTQKQLNNLGWEKIRLDKAMDSLFKQGIIWKDALTDKVVSYYIFSLFEEFNR